MNIFQRVYEAIKNEPAQIIPDRTGQIRLKMQSRIWYKLGPVPSVLEAKRDAIFMQKIGEMGREMYYEGQRQYKAKQSTALATIQHQLSWGHAFEQACLGVNLHRRSTQYSNRYYVNPKETEYRSQL